MENALTILVVDDDRAIRRFLTNVLAPEGHTLHECGSGTEAIHFAAVGRPDIVLLDLGLPDLDGVDVCLRIREWSEVPIIILSARGRESDKVKALDAGADDYLTKPFGVHELMARIRVAMRHSASRSIPDATVKAGNVTIDLAARRVYKCETELKFTPNEYKFLAVLARHAGKVVTHRQLLLEVWGPEYDQEVHYLRVYAQQIRSKIEDNPSLPAVLQTESGVGYRLVADN